MEINSRRDCRILLLSESESKAALDRRSLRDAGVSEIRLLTSGITAARLLAGMEKDKFRPDILVCGERLADMEGEQFCAIVRQHPLLLGLPILLVLSKADDVEQLRTLGCGASALLGRPYTVRELGDQLDSLLKSALPRRYLEEGRANLDTSAFDKALANYGVLLKPERQPEDFFRVGLRLLREKRYNMALNAFQRALRGAQIKGEAELGIAQAYRGKGDSSRSRAWLARSSETFVLARRWHRARTVFARLLQEDPQAKNPFLAEAHRLIRQKEYDLAGETLAQGLPLMPSLKVPDRFARTCLSADDPISMCNALEHALVKESKDIAQALAGEIRQSLDVLIKERAERQRQSSEERQWKLARGMGEQKMSAEKPVSGIEVRGHERIAPVLEEMGALQDDSPFASSSPEDDEDEHITALAPLRQDEATSGLFAKSPKLNELLSVIKLTWKLQKRHKKE